MLVNWPKFNQVGSVLDVTIPSPHAVLLTAPILQQAARQPFLEVGGIAAITR